MMMMMFVNSKKELLTLEEKRQKESQEGNNIEGTRRWSMLAHACYCTRNKVFQETCLSALFFAWLDVFLGVQLLMHLVLFSL